MDVDPTTIPLPDGEVVPSRDIKLPPFWSRGAAAWFTFTEIRFRIKNVTNETAKFDCVINSLPEEIKGKILDIICRGGSGGQPLRLSEVKNRMLESHQFSNYKKWTNW